MGTDVGFRSKVRLVCKDAGVSEIKHWKRSSLWRKIYLSPPENQTSGSTPRFTAGDTEKGIASSAFPFTLANFEVEAC
jgi:hypothetical protein